MNSLIIWFAVALLPLQTSDPTALLRAGRFEDALDVVDQELKVHPRDFRLLAIRGIALMSLGNEPGALSAYRGALAISPEYLPALQGVAQIEYKSADKAALGHLNQLIRLHNSDLIAHAMRAELFARAADCTRAVPDFEAAMPVVRQQRESLRHYGVCLVKSGRVSDAKLVFSELQASDPSDARAAYALAVLELQAKECTEALATLAGLGGDAQALALRSEAYEGLGRTPEAIESLRNAIVAAPLREDLYTQFAQLCFTYKSYQAGIDVINAGLTQLPKSAELFVARGVLFVQQGNYASADKDFATAELLNPREPSSADAAVLALIQANRLNEAETDVEAKLRQHPNDPQLSYFLADVLDRKGAQPGTPEFRRSLNLARKAITLRPDFALAHDLLARLYQENGSEDLAVTESYAALKYDADDETALYRLLRILKSRHASGDESALADLTSRWQQARAKQRAAEQRESSFRITTQAEEKATAVP